MYLPNCMAGREVTPVSFAQVSLLAAGVGPVIVVYDKRHTQNLVRNAPRLLKS